MIGGCYPPCVRRIALLLAGGCVLGLSGCERPGHREDEVVRLDSAGGRAYRVIDRAPPDESEVTWRARAVWRVGGNPGDTAVLLQNQLVAPYLAPDGNTYLLHHSAREVIVVSRDGKAIRTVGRRGQGPGDLAGPIAIFVDAKRRLWVADWSNRKYAVFDSLGRLVETHPRPVPTAQGLASHLVLGEDSVLYGVGGTGSPAVSRIVGVHMQSGVMVEGVELPAAVVPSELQAAYARTRDPALRDIVYNYTARGRWAVAPGASLWWGWTSSDSLFYISSSGDTTDVIVRPGLRRALSGREKDRIHGALRRAGVAAGEVDLDPPLIDQIRVAQDGRVFVGYADVPGEGARFFEVFDPTGIPLGILDLGFRTPWRSTPHIVGDTILAVEITDNDVPVLVRILMERQ